MNDLEALEILKAHNAWRRDIDDDLSLPMQSPKEIGIAIDIAIDRLEFLVNSIENVNG